MDLWSCLRPWACPWFLMATLEVELHLIVVVCGRGGPASDQDESLASCCCMYGVCVGEVAVWACLRLWACPWFPMATFEVEWQHLVVVCGRGGPASD